MGEVRNKIVFVNRNRNINDVGIHVEWQNDTTFKSDGKVNFYIQDHYGVDSFDYKARQENLWVNSGSGSSPIVRNSAILRTS